MTQQWTNEMLYKGKVEEDPQQGIFSRCNFFNTIFHIFSVTVFQSILFLFGDIVWHHYTNCNPRMELSQPNYTKMFKTLSPKFRYFQNCDSHSEIPKQSIKFRNLFKFALYSFSRSFKFALFKLAHNDKIWPKSFEIVYNKTNRQLLSIVLYIADQNKHFDTCFTPSPRLVSNISLEKSTKI